MSLGGSDLRGLDLSDVNFAGANLVKALLDGCLLARADLSDVRWGETSLRNADLRQAKLTGLDPRLVDVAGSTIGPDQAIELARYFGVTVA